MTLSEDRKATLDYILAGCNCTSRELTDEERDRHGVELHSPYCPVGRLERETGVIHFTPFGTTGAETREET